jgi:Tfp pilus assembly protein PilF
MPIRRLLLQIAIGKAIYEKLKFHISLDFELADTVYDNLQYKLSTGITYSEMNAVLKSWQASQMKQKVLAYFKNYICDKEEQLATCLYLAMASIEDQDMHELDNKSITSEARFEEAESKDQEATKTGVITEQKEDDDSGVLEDAIGFDDEEVASDAWEGDWDTELDEDAYVTVLRDFEFRAKGDVIKDLSNDYSVSFYLEESHVLALARYEYAFLTGRSSDQAMKDFHILCVADQSIVEQNPEALMEDNDRQLHEAIESALNGKPTFLGISNYGHWAVIALLPSGNGEVKVIYMNSAYGKGAESYFGCKPVGLSLCQNVVGQINSKKLMDNSPRAQLFAEHIYLEQTQQIETNCGAIAGLNMAGIAAWHRIGNEVPLEKFLGGLKYNAVLLSPNKREAFEALIKSRFNGIKTGSISAASSEQVASSILLKAVMDDEYYIAIQHQILQDQEATERLFKEEQRSLTESYDIRLQEEMLKSIVNAHSSSNDGNFGKESIITKETMDQAFDNGNQPNVMISLSAVEGDYVTVEKIEQNLAHQKNALIVYEYLYEAPHPDIAIALYDVSLAYEALGDVTKSLDYQSQALKMKQALYKGDHPEVAESLDRMGLAYETLGDVTKSLDYYEQALKMRQTLYKGDHPEVAASLYAVGSAHQALGDITRSLNFYEQALKMRRALCPGNHPDVADSLNAVGFAHQALGDMNKGLYYGSLALNMRKALYKGDHPDVAQSLNNVGVAYESFGDIRNGLDYKEQALKMRKALYPGDHPDVANSLNNVGIIYQALGDVRKGLDYKEQALRMMQALYKGNHPDVAASLNNVGLAYEAFGDVKKGLDYYEQALKMRQTLYEGDHPDVAQSLNNVGIAYQALGDVRKGLDYQERALKMRIDLYRGDHPDIAQSLNNVGTAYQALGDVGKGLDYQEQALMMHQAIYRGYHPDIAASLNNAGIAYKALGDVRRGLDYQEQALKMMQALYRADHPDVATLLNNIGVAYQAFGDVRRGLDYKEQALKIRQTLHGGDHPDVATSLSSVGSAYKTLGDPKKWLDYSKLALKMRQALYKGAHPYVAASLNSVGHAYKASGDMRKWLYYSKLASKMKQTIAAPSSQEVQEFKGLGALGGAVDSRFEYYNSGVDQILELRINSLRVTANLRVLRSQYYTKWSDSAIGRLVNDVEFASSNSQVQMVLAPINLHNEHWLGLLFNVLGDAVEVTYMDSEQRAMVPQLKDGLERHFAMNGYKSQFLEARLEKQIYNNCGPEVIENFVYHLTSARATQEVAVYVHSLLVENSLLNPEEYRLKIAENNKIIGFLSNSVLLPIRSMEAFLIEQRPLHHASSQRKLGSSPFSSESWKPGSICEDGSSGQARRKGLDPSFRWDDAGGGVDAIDLNLLPVIKQFNRLWAKWVQDKIIQVNSVVYKTTLGFKGLDLMVDSARLVYEPEIDNAKKVVYDVSHLYGMAVGVNGYSTLVSGAEVAYQLHLGEYQKACEVAISTASAMALPAVLAVLNRPYLGFIYGVWMAASTAYNAIENAYSFASALTEESRDPGFEFMAGQVVGHGDNSL